MRKYTNAISLFYFIIVLQPSVVMTGTLNNLLNGVTSSYSATPPSNVYITETGYHTDTFQNGVTEAAQVFSPLLFFSSPLLRVVSLFSHTKSKIRQNCS